MISKSARRPSTFMRSLPRSRGVWALIFLATVLLSQRITLCAAPQDSKGLLPPVGLDRSPAVARIRACLAAGDLAGAQTESNKVMAQEGGNFEGYFWRGFVELQRENGYNAVRFLRRAEALDANAYVLKLLAVSYYTLRQFRLFTLTMNEAARKQPDDFAPYYYLGRYYVSDEISDWDKASECFRESLQRNPTHVQSCYYLGYCYETKGKIAHAEREYRHAMELADAAAMQFALPQQGMARLRLSQNRPAEALSFARRAVELAGKDAGGFKVLAKAYEGLGQAAEAAFAWQRAATIDPTDPSPYYHLYRIYSTMGKQDKANAAYAQFKKLSSMY